MCKVKIEHKNKQKMCNFYVVPWNRQALVGMPDIDTLNITNINCNTIDTQETDRANNCCTNTVICQGSRYEQHFTNMIQEVDRVEKCYANTDSISKFDKKDKPTVIDKEPKTISYFFPGPIQDSNKGVSAVITQLHWDFKDVFTGIVCFDGTFSLEGKIRQQTLPGIPEMCSLCTAKALQRGVRMTPTTRYRNTARWWWRLWNSATYFTSPQIWWISQAVPGLSKARPSTHKSGAQRTHTEWYFTETK